MPLDLLNSVFTCFSARSSRGLTKAGNTHAVSVTTAEPQGARAGRDTDVAHTPQPTAQQHLNPDLLERLRALETLRQAGRPPTSSAGKSQKINFADERFDLRPYPDKQRYGAFLEMYDDLQHMSRAELKRNMPVLISNVAQLPVHDQVYAALLVFRHPNFSSSNLRQLSDIAASLLDPKTRGDITSYILHNSELTESFPFSTIMTIVEEMKNSPLKFAAVRNLHERISRLDDPADRRRLNARLLSAATSDQDWSSE